MLSKLTLHRVSSTDQLSNYSQYLGRLKPNYTNSLNYILVYTLGNKHIWHNNGDNEVIYPFSAFENLFYIPKGV
jgi:hypothetical protein